MGSLGRRELKLEERVQNYLRQQNYWYRRVIDWEKNDDYKALLEFVENILKDYNAILEEKEF